MHLKNTQRKRQYLIKTPTRTECDSFLGILFYWPGNGFEPFIPFWGRTVGGKRGSISQMSALILCLFLTLSSWAQDDCCSSRYPITNYRNEHFLLKCNFQFLLEEKTLPRFFFFFLQVIPTILLQTLTRFLPLNISWWTYNCLSLVNINTPESGDGLSFPKCISAWDPRPKQN